MQVVTPQAWSQAGLTLNLVIGVLGSQQALSRLKAKLELAVEDAVQGLSQEASHELGIEIGRWNIETSTSQPEVNRSASSGPAADYSIEAPATPLESASEGSLKAGSCL